MVELGAENYEQNGVQALVEELVVHQPMRGKRLG